jgi:hypothetical protein
MIVNCRVHSLYLRNTPLPRGLLSATTTQIELSVGCQAAKGTPTCALGHTKGWATIDSTALPKAQTPVAPSSLRPGCPAPLRAHPPPRQSASGWPACRQQVAAGRLRGAGVQQEPFSSPKSWSACNSQEDGQNINQLKRRSIMYLRTHEGLGQPTSSSSLMEAQINKATMDRPRMWGPGPRPA